MHSQNASDPLSQEQLLTFSQAVRLLPKINGRYRSASTLHRWSRRGCRGVKLEFTRIGHCVATSREAIDRFLEAVRAVDETLWQTRKETGK